MPVSSLVLRSIRSRATARARTRITGEAKAHIQTLNELRADRPAPESNAALRRLCVRTAYREIRDLRVFRMSYLLFNVLVLIPVLLFSMTRMVGVSERIFLTVGVAFGIFATIMHFLRVNMTAGFRMAITALSVAFLGTFLWIVAGHSVSSDAVAGEAVGSATTVLGGWAVAVAWWLLCMASAAVSLSTFVVLTDLVEEFSSPETTAFGLMLKFGALLTDEAAFSEAGGRREAMDILERLARCVERGMARGYRVSSPSLNHVIEGRLRAAAAAVRERQVWIALPAEHTRNDLMAFAWEFIDVLASGRYDSLPHGELADEPATRRMSAVINVGRTVLGAVLPISAVVVLSKYTNLLPEGSARVAMFVVASLLAVVSVMSLLDPGFVNRITTTKDVAMMVKDARGV